MDMMIPLTWQVGYTDTFQDECHNFVNAVVPGAVQLDWANANQWPDYWYGDNYKKFLWMEDKYWTYRTKLNFQCHSSHRALLIFRGIDYQYVIRIDGDIVHQGEGMFTPVQLDITRYANQSSCLEVTIYPVPKATQNHDRTQASESCKPAVSYGWDWHPRLVPSGIWDEAYLQIVPQNYIKSWKLSYELNSTLTKADITIDVNLNEDAEIKLELLDVHANILINKNLHLSSGENTVRLELDNPELWWAIGYGQQNLYTIKASLVKNACTLQEIEKKIGFRRVKLVMNEGEWSKPVGFPKTCSTVPITVELNGVRIFAKGSNWINPEIFPGIINYDTYKKLLDLVRDANMNMLRVWGGGIVNKDCFYRLCDELGIMVWQEFPLACNKYPDSKEYLEILDQESVNIIERLREHPSVVMWCGGNELFNSWSGMTNQSLALRLLNKNCYEYDRNTPFIMTSPSYGMAHGHYHNVDFGKEEFIGTIIKSCCTAYTEFGCPGPSSPEYIKSFMTEDEYVHCEPGTVWEDHHAFNAWDPEDTWLRKSEAEYYFGGYDNVDDLLEKCSFIQSISYKAMFEEMRRQWPRCSMAINWCLNEPWPTAANNSIINWPAVPKPCYSFIQEALRSQMTSVRASKYLWSSGEEFNAELWVLNEKTKILKGDYIRVYLEMDGVKEELLSWNFKDVNSQTNIKGPTVQILLPETGKSIFKLYTEVDGNKMLNSTYYFIIKKGRARQTGRDLLNL